MVNEAASRPGDHGLATAHAGNPGGHRLAQLDGLRGIAAIAVMVYHIHNIFGLTLGFERAYLFVDVFFMLSGFVLQLAWSSTSRRDFDAAAVLKARVRRLWPTIAAAAILGAIIHAVLGDVAHPTTFLLLALLIVPAIWNDGAIFPLNGPQWSLFWEGVANLVHVLWLRRLTERELVLVSLVMGLSVITAIELWGAAMFGPTSNGWWLALARVGWSYTAGMLIGRRYQGTAWRPVLAWWQALALPMLVVLALPFVPLPTKTGDELLIIVVFPLLFWLLATARPPRRAREALARLGALSFPLYAVHLPLLDLFAGFGAPRIAAAALATTASLLFAMGLSGAGRRRGEMASPTAVAGNLPRRQTV